MSESRTFLRHNFAELHAGRQPHVWQEQLFERIVAGDPPPSVTAPTGAGKTSLISLWLIGLAWQARGNKYPSFPRRLVWVVNRRVVVDQATQEAMTVRGRLAQVPELSEPLREICLPSNLPLAISTLRGEFADNREWIEDPSRPAIIVGTVDMIGSRLLFSGYGDSFRTRPHHAGLLGYDSLLVNDEAHLTPAFASLLSQLAARTKIQTIRLSATPFEVERFPEDFNEDLNREGEFRKRYQASKRLHLHEAANTGDARHKVVQLATHNPAPRTIVFVTKPEDAATIAKQIRAKVTEGSQVVVLTGTQRGYERQQQSLDNFRSNQEPSQPCWMVSTSAGEVGMDASCSRLITLLESADHLIQRFGRLNRFGETTGEAHIVYVPPPEKQKRESATLQYLRKLQAIDGVFNISNESLFENPPPGEAMTERPAEAPLTTWAIDRWSLTTAGNELKPKVESWLHGRQKDLPETQVCWRSDISQMAKQGVPSEEIEKALRLQRPRASELLREPTYRLKEKLTDHTVPRGAVILRADGRVVHPEVGANLFDSDDLAYGTLILPPGIFGLQDGMLAVEKDDGDDIAESDQSERQRFVATRVTDGFEIAPLLEPDNSELALTISAYLADRQLKLAHLVELPAELNSDETPPKFVVYARNLPAAPAAKEIGLERHQAEVAVKAALMAQKVFADPEIEQVFRWAGAHHDLGKRCDVWRRAMNCPEGEFLAKTGKRNKPKGLNGFRHELASLRDAQAFVGSVGDAHRDLALHLIACHHGYGRPYFLARACGPESLTEQFPAARLRFDRLQKQYGPWKLAYLEALFRSADWSVSRSETPTPGENPDD